MTMTEIRVAQRADLDGLMDLVNEFAQGHPSRDYPRSKEAFEEAYFGEKATAEVIIAVRNDQVVGMLEWHMMFDMFWTMYHGLPEWLFVSRRCRGSGICLSLLAFACERVRQGGGKAVYIFANESSAPMLERISFGNGPSSFYHLSNESFQQLADLVGEAARRIVANLPAKELCKVERSE